jgi:hypothetical protein
MSGDKSSSAATSEKPRPMGWFVGIGVLLITLGVVVGLIGVGLVAMRKQRYRIDQAPTESPATNSAR